MKWYLRLLVATLLLSMPLAGCSSGAGASPTEEEPVEPQETQQITGEPTGEIPSADSHGGPVENYVSLVDALRAEGMTVEPKDEIQQEFFSVTGQVIVVNGQDVQVFEYESDEAAQLEAGTISPDGGSVGTTMMMWVATPHFYQKARLIVLYIGDNAEIKAALESALGPPVAGGA